MGWLVMRALLAVAVVTLASTATTASGGTDDAKAQALYDEAKADVAAGKWTDACPKLATSQKLAPKMNTAYRLAECYEHIGKRASAAKRYREAAIAATTAGETGKAKAALDRAEKLQQAGLPKLSVVAAAGCEVRIDGEPLTSAELAGPFAIDPGEHAVEATAPQKKSYRASFVIPEGASTTTLAIPELENEVTAAPITEPAPPPLKDPEPTAPPTNTTKVIGMVLAGTGVVAIGIGGFLALSARSKYHDADPHCPPAGCDEIGAQATEDARRLGNVATVVIGAGLALGITGTVLWLTAPSHREAPRAALTLTPTGVLLRGEF